jgi:hypothetical protein
VKLTYAIFFAALVHLNLNAQNLNYYFGNLHAHTSYSDGNKDSASSLMTTPYQAFMYAKQSQHIDFYGISEHNHEGAGIKSPVYYQFGLRDADSVNVDGQFVAMYGMEWGVISTGGHSIVYGIDSLCGWDFSNTEIHVSEGDYTSLWKVINRKKAAFGYLAHPSSGDYDNMLALPVNAIADQAVVGSAIRSGPAFSTNSSYSNPSTGNYLSFYNSALRNGFHLGPVMDHDTHNSVFGRQTKGRLAVLSPLLSRPEIVEGIRRRRIYASDDWNAKVDFKIGGQAMGSIFENVSNPTLSVQITDPDNETASSIAVYAGIPGSGANPTVLTTVNNTNTLNFTHSIADGQEYYYYLYISQTDGDKIWTAPIWYKKNNAFTSVTSIADFSNYRQACKNYSYQLLDSSSSNVVSWWWDISGATPQNSSLQNPDVIFNNSGIFNVILTVTNINGVQTTITKQIQVIDPPIVTITASKDSICRGNSVWLYAQGASSYVWWNGTTIDSINVAPQGSTNYSVKTLLAGCEVKATKLVKVYQALVTPVISIVGDSISSTYANGNVWYQGGVINPNITSNTFLPEVNGYYYAYVVDSNGCRSSTSNAVNYNKVGIDEAASDVLQFAVYPIPSVGELHLKPYNDAIIESLAMLDMNGKVLLRSIVEHRPYDTYDAEIAMLPNGLYTLEIYTNKGVFKKQITLKK